MPAITEYRPPEATGATGQTWLAQCEAEVARYRAQGRDVWVRWYWLRRGPRRAWVRQVAVFERVRRKRKWSLWPCRDCGALNMEDAGNKCIAGWLCAADDQRERDYERTKRKATVNKEAK